MLRRIAIPFAYPAVGKEDSSECSQHRPRRTRHVDQLQSASSIGDIGEVSIQNDCLGTARGIEGSCHQRTPGIRNAGDKEPGGAVRDEGIAIPDHDILRLAGRLETPGYSRGERL